MYEIELLLLLLVVVLVVLSVEFELVVEKWLNLVIFVIVWLLFDELLFDIVLLLVNVVFEIVRIVVVIRSFFMVDFIMVWRE